MAKLLRGKIVSLKMANTAVVEVVRRMPHPLYKKLLKRSNKFLADTNGVKNLTLGQEVVIVETAPISKRKNFKLMKEVKSKV